VWYSLVEAARMVLRAPVASEYHTQPRSLKFALHTTTLRQRKGDDGNE
jgi:hypothetical protein